MSLGENLKLVNLPIAISLTVGIFATFAPGSLILFYFNEDLFQKLDLMKVLLISCALTLPSLLAPYVISIVSETGRHAKTKSILEIDHLSFLIIHGANSGLNIYTSLAASYFFNLSFTTFMIIYIAFTFLAIGSEVYHSAKRKMEKDGVDPTSAEQP